MDTLPPGQGRGGISMLPTSFFFMFTQNGAGLGPSCRHRMYQKGQGTILQTEGLF
jgi:hypothetical protein